MSKNSIAILGQPNSGKSTLFNALTGSRQHVGNWPGKTVEKKEGFFTYNNKKYRVMDLPGSYSLSAASPEEIVTRDCIASGNADTVYILSDASQLERSLFMLADYVGIKTPAVLVVNMIDVAREQGKIIDTAVLEKKLGIPVIAMSADKTKEYQGFFATLEQDNASLSDAQLSSIYRVKIGEPFTQLLALLPKEGLGAYSAAWLAAKLLENDPVAMDLVQATLTAPEYQKIREIQTAHPKASLLIGEAKFAWIVELLKDAVQKTSSTKPLLGRFDRLATHHFWGKPLAIGIILLGLVLSFIPAIPFMLLGGSFPSVVSPPLAALLSQIGLPQFFISLVCDAVITAVGFSIAMVGFVVGVSFVFGLMEEIGYMARISYVFDSAMSRLGLQGKAVMPFLVSFGCTMGGAAGARVIDTWGQRVLTILLAWAVPCAGTWGVVGLMTGTFFGAGAPLVILSLFLVALVHMVITAKIFQPMLVPASAKTGLIMELPPYHKPKWGNLFRFTLTRMSDILIKALKVVTLTAVLFWLLSYAADGDISKSIIYRVGTAIEPVTKIFGLNWQLFMAFVASAMGKEAALGVLSTLFSTGSGVFASAIGQGLVAENLTSVLLTVISKPQALAFIFAFTFNIPCLMAMASTYQEIHSLKWTLRIALYYVASALVYAFLAYHVGLLIF